MYERRLVFLIMIARWRLRFALIIMAGSCSYFLEWEVRSINSVCFVMAVILDWMSMLFLSFVMFISSIVLYYRGSYIEGDKNLSRFLYLVLGFVGSIIFLIISPNLISILLGWDGLGLVSYALVIFYQNEKSANAGMLTALSNRVGDVAILLRISLILSLGRWRYIFYQREVRGQALMFVVLAAITKRAQIPFSAWLPAAMAAPTPVSALVHSSTLVTAGVYLLIRFHEALFRSEHSRVLLLLARLTIFIAGLGANFETDLKKIIALSTLRQLGVIICSLSLGRADLAFLHLLAHALFKALLFICAGSIIHRVGDYQDVRVIGSIVKFIPIRVTLINLANLALCGMPFLTGFYSKDLLLEIRFQGDLNELCFWLLIMSTGLTVCYTYRLRRCRFTGDYNLLAFSNVRDESVVITWPIIVLGGSAIVGGAVLSWLIIPCPEVVCISLLFKNSILLISLLGVLLGYLINSHSCGQRLLSISSLGYPIVNFAGSIWYIPFLSTNGISLNFIKLGRKYHQLGDIGWSELYGGQGRNKILIEISKGLQTAQDNNIKTYMVILVLWLIVIGMLV